VGLGGQRGQGTLLFFCTNSRRRTPSGQGSL